MLLGNFKDCCHGKQMPDAKSGICYSVIGNKSIDDCL
jgi:hypothetical protein